jgi:hypothetical protein
MIAGCPLLNLGEGGCHEPGSLPPPHAPDPKTGRGASGHRPAPYEGAVTLVSAKIQGEPFLFVIAVAALLVDLAILAAAPGSPTLRLTMTLIGVLAFVVILGYYVLEAVRVARRRPEPTAADPGSSPPPVRHVSGKAFLVAIEPADLECCRLGGGRSGR